MTVSDLIRSMADDELAVFIKKNLDLYYKLAVYKLFLEKSVKFFMDISSDNEN